MFQPVPKRKAITLLELLVVIAVIAVLAALLLPAIQRVRESAAVAQCLNNQKQYALALYHYKHNEGHFPARKLGWFAKGWGWMIHILPYIDERAAYDLIGFDDPGYPGPACNSVVPVRQITAPWFRCPSERGPAVRDDRRLALDTCTSTRPGDFANYDGIPATPPTYYYKLAIIHYVGSAGDGYSGDPTDPFTTVPTYGCGGCNDSGNGSTPVPSAQCPKPTRHFGGGLNCRGIFEYVGYPTWRVRDIPDGYSNTILTGHTMLPMRGSTNAWVNPHGPIGVTSLPPNYGREQAILAGNASGISGNGMGFSSMHPLGVTVSMCDGVARFIRNDVDLLVLNAMGSRDGGEAFTHPE